MGVGKPNAKPQPKTTAQTNTDAVGDGSPVLTQTSTKSDAELYNAAPMPDLSKISDIDIRTHELLAAQAPDLATITKLDAKTPTINTSTSTTAQTNSNTVGVDAHIDPELSNVIEAAKAGMAGKRPKLIDSQTTKPVVEPTMAELIEISNAAIEGRKPNLPVKSSTTPAVDENGEMQYNQRRRKTPTQLEDLFEPAKSPEETTPLTQGEPRPYTVFHEATIGETKSRSSHRRRANKELYARLESDSDFRKQLDEMLGYDVMAYMKTGKGALKNPSPDLVWHHPVDNRYAVELIYKKDHQDPKMQKYLHPAEGGRGGYGVYYK